MAHLTSAAVWTVDTSIAGLVSSTPVFIEYIMITWKISSAGTLLMQEHVTSGSVGTAVNPILDALSAGSSTAAQNVLTQQFWMNRVFQNVWATTMTNVGSLYIYTR